MTFLNYYLTFFFFLFASHAFGYAFCFLAGQRDFKKYLLKALFCVNPFLQCSHQCEITAATNHQSRQCFKSRRIHTSLFSAASQKLTLGSMPSVPFSLFLINQEVFWTFWAIFILFGFSFWVSFGCCSIITLTVYGLGFVERSKTLYEEHSWGIHNALNERLKCQNMRAKLST